MNPLEEAQRRLEALERQQAALEHRLRLSEVRRAGKAHGLRPEAAPCAVALLDWSTIADDFDLDWALDELYASDAYLFDTESRPFESRPVNIGAGARDHGNGPDWLDPNEISDRTARERLSRGHDPWRVD